MCHPAALLTAFTGLLFLAQSLFASPEVFEPTIVFDQNMSKLSAWQSVDGSNPKPITLEGVASSSAMQLNNGIVAAALTRPIPAGTDWTLKCELLFSAYQRGGWVGLFDNDRKQGFAVLLNSAKADAHGGTGGLMLMQCERDTPISKWKDDRRPGKFLLKRLVATGHNPAGSNGALTPPLIQIELRYSASLKTLTLLSNGKTIATVDAPELAGSPNLTQVMMSGNTSMYVDNIEVIATLPMFTQGNPSESVMTLNVKDFGAVGDNQHDNTQAFRDAIEKLRAVDGPKQLLIPKGIYRLSAKPDTKHTEAHLLIADINDLHVKAEPGTELIMTSLFHDGVGIRGCKNVTIENLTIDYDPLPYTQGTIIEADPASRSFVVQADPGYPLVTDPHIQAPRTKNIAYLYRPGTTLKLDEFFDQYIEQIEALDGRRFRLTSRNPVELDFVGNKVAMVGRRRAQAVVFHQSADSTARNITIYSAPSLGFGLQRTDNITIDRCTITQRPGTDRLMSTVADGIHVKWGSKGPTIENCWLEGMGDDSVNVGGTYQAIIKQLDERTIIVENHGSLLGASDNVMFVDKQTGMVTPLSKCLEVKTIQWKGKLAKRLTFAQPLPEIDITRENSSAGKGQTDMVINYDQVAANPVIRNNFFGRHRVRGVLVRSPGALIEGNRFEDLLGPAIRVGHHYGGRIEGPNGSNTIIRNNTFTNIRRSVVTVKDSGPSSKANPVKARSIQNIVIQDNRFNLYGLPSAYGAGQPGNVMLIDNVRNVLIKDNYIDYRHPMGVEAPLVVIQRATDVTIEGTIIQGESSDPADWLEITDDAKNIHINP